MRRRTLFASVVGIGSGRESTEGGREERGELGRDDGRLVRRLLVLDDFLSLDNDAVRDGCRSGCLYGSREGWKDGSLRSSETGRDAADEKEPILLRASMAGASCCRKAPSMVWVLGLKGFERRGGLDEGPSKEPGKESLNTTPWRLAGKLLAVVGMDLGEVCGDEGPRPRGACGTLLAVPSGPLSAASGGSGVTALTVCRKAPRRLLAEGLSVPRGDGTSESGGSTELRAGRSGRGGGLAPWGLVPRE
jgi:hypothetical protein